jgi:hypothetical protein
MEAFIPVVLVGILYAIHQLAAWHRRRPRDLHAELDARKRAGPTLFVGYLNRGATRRISKHLVICSAAVGICVLVWRGSEIGPFVVYAATISVGIYFSGKSLRNALQCRRNWRRHPDYSRLGVIKAPELVVRELNAELSRGAGRFPNTKAIFTNSFMLRPSRYGADLVYLPAVSRAYVHCTKYVFNFVPVALLCSLVVDSALGSVEIRCSRHEADILAVELRRRCLTAR